MDRVRRPDRPQRLIGTCLETWLGPDCVLEYAKDHWLVVLDVRNRDYQANLVDWEQERLSERAKALGAWYQPLEGLLPYAASNNNWPARNRAGHYWRSGFGLLALFEGAQLGNGDFRDVMGGLRYEVGQDSILLFGTRGGADRGAVGTCSRYDSEQLSLF